MFRLAEALGHPSPRRLLQEMTTEDLADWVAWEAVAGPVGKARTDLLCGQLMACMIAVRGVARGDVPDPRALLPFSTPWTTLPEADAATTPEAFVALFRNMAEKMADLGAASKA